MLSKTRQLGPTWGYTADPASTLDFSDLNFRPLKMKMYFPGIL